MQKMILRTAAAALVPLVALVISAATVTPAHAESAVVPTNATNSSVTGTTTVAPSTERPALAEASNENALSIDFEIPGLDPEVLRMAVAASDTSATSDASTISDQTAK